MFCESTTRREGEYANFRICVIEQDNAPLAGFPWLEFISKSMDLKLGWSHLVRAFLSFAVSSPECEDMTVPIESLQSLGPGSSQWLSDVVMRSHRSEQSPCIL
jgi:hypothetical protein